MKTKKFYPWLVVALLWVVALLNYMDRQMLSTMQGAMKLDIVELQKAEAFGALMAVFLWIYGIVSPFAGVVADRVSRKKLVVGSLFVWSAVTYLMGYATDFTQLYCLRALMGVSEALYIPSALSLIADWHEGKSRSLAPPFPKIGRIEELVEYCETIANAAPELPFYYYHIPAFNGAYLPMVDLLKAVDGRIKNFAGIKYTYEALYEYNQCRLYGGGKFDMLHGQDETILPSLAQGGARGGIGGTTNYNGRELVGIIDAWNRGDIETAREKQNFSQEVINVICHFRGNIVGGKRIMKLLGFDLGPNRVPFRNMTDEEEAQMKKELEEIGFFERANQF